MSKRATKKTTKNPMQTAFTRFMLIVAFFVLWIGGIGARLVHLQINQYEFLRGKALNQRRDNTKEKQLRGTIYDRSDRALAMSLKVKSLYADPSEIEDADAAAKEVAKVLKVKPNDIAAKIKDAKTANKRYIVLAPKLDEDTVQKINDALENKGLRKGDLPRFAGLHWKEEQKRSYPGGSLAAQVIGFSNADDIGSAGIEQSQELALRGAVIKGWQDRDRLGRVYDESEEEEREPPKDVVLTISHSIQYKVEQALAQGVKNSNAKSGMAIVMIPQTGEILAMANYPTFDPNKYNEFSAENYSNRAIHDIYSPGSVFKLVTYSSAINEGLVNPNGEIDCTKGFIEVAGHRFNDPHATKWMGYDEALAVSSNVAAIKTALSTGKENFYNYAQKFGFGQATGVELPAEASGIFRSPKSWNGDSLASMSIGYEISVSALQMASAYATIANDGVRVQPHIIKEIRQDGKVLSSTEAQKTQVVTADTARYLKRMLREVVLKGTGKRAQLNGYTAAGKTGTAWKYNAKLKKVDSGKYVSSFIGMAPADNPSVVILVVMDEPSGGARDGGQVSAPVFREIAEQILPELNVVPDANIRQETLTADDIPSEIEPNSAGKTESEKTAKNEKADKKSADAEKPKDLKEPKKENKPPSDNKKGAKQKTAALMIEIPKNKSSGAREEEKT
ncbi:MAG TPA: penicillin-binding protein 2 [Pyrinomonadaceae bacterium]|nr:penicillin-binding protein 2 [Pyrinomonadaceae bacterium]